MYENILNEFNVGHYGIDKVKLWHSIQILTDHESNRKIHIALDIQLGLESVDYYPLVNPAGSYFLFASGNSQLFPGPTTLSTLSKFFLWGLEIRTRQGLHTPCVEKTLFIISTGGVVLMPAINKLRM